jgi:hypothetical protein
MPQSKKKYNQGWYGASAVSYSVVKSYHPNTRLEYDDDDDFSDTESLQSEFTDITDSTNGTFEPESWENNLIHVNNIPKVKQCDAFHPKPVQQLEPNRYTQLTVLNKNSDTTHIQQNGNTQYRNWSEAVRKVL